jgi:hypothetical protein
LAAAKGDSFLLLKFRLMAKARVLKKTGFFVESLRELESLDVDLLQLIGTTEHGSKLFMRYTKLRVRLLREKMSILATTKDYERAFQAYEAGFEL